RHQRSLRPTFQTSCGGETTSLFLRLLYLLLLGRLKDWDGDNVFRKLPVFCGALSVFPILAFLPSAPLHPKKGTRPLFMASAAYPRPFCLPSSFSMFLFGIQVIARLPSCRHPVPYVVVRRLFHSRSRQNALLYAPDTAPCAAAAASTVVQPSSLSHF
ncbi:unnamed protein product, partial [Phaeothamnion confervicola]